MLIFNNTGLLVPDNKISSNIKEIDSIFVQQLPSEKRKQLFDKLLMYNEELKSMTGVSELHQWIDGSFVTKKTNPGDIDLVTFINHLELKRIGSGINDFVYPTSESKYGVDAYIIEVYPKGHKFEFRTVSDRAYWVNRFTKTRRNRYGNKLSKGFLEIYT